MQSPEAILGVLLEQTQRGHVFGEGEAFGDLDASRKQIMNWDVHIMHDAVTDILYRQLSEAAPDKSEDHRRREVGQVATKTTVFVPGLTAGEIGTASGRQKLVWTAVGTGGMYLMDQDVDRGDKYARRAVEVEGSGRKFHPYLLHPRVRSRRKLFGFIREAIGNISEEDAPDVNYCFRDLVLCNEVDVFNHSKRYERLNAVSREAYLDEHGREIAELMVSDAGYQSVTSILHAVYRAEEPGRGLPLIRDIHGDRQMQRNIQVWNAVARVADERGDWKMDSGAVPEMGVFSINPFNDYHPALVDKLCDLAEIDDAALSGRIHDWFKHFHTSNDGRDAVGHYITEAFFDQMRYTIRDMDPDFRKKYDRYVTLAMRVGEIAWVNMMGDIAMSGETDID
jgi:hypothetical protein